MTRWHVITVAPQRELHVGAEIKRGIGIKTSVPAVTRHRRARGKLGKIILRPYPYVLMPGYVFVGHRFGMPWHDVSAIRYVTGWLEMAGEPATLSDREMTRVQEMAAEIALSTPGSWAIGDKARIMAGPFANFQSMIETIRGETCEVTVQMFGRSNTVRVPVAHLERVA